MDFNLWRLVMMPLANFNLERAVRNGNEGKARKALANGADPSLRLMHGEGMPYGVPFVGAWRLVDDGDILSLSMQLGHDRIGLLLANAGAQVPGRYQDRIVQQRWQSRIGKPT